MYTGDIADEELLELLRERRPRHIVVTIGGGTQEGLGLYIKLTWIFRRPFIASARPSRS